MSTIYGTAMSTFLAAAHSPGRENQGLRPSPRLLPPRSRVRGGQPLPGRDDQLAVSPRSQSQATAASPDNPSQGQTRRDNGQRNRDTGSRGPVTRDHTGDSDILLIPSKQTSLAGRSSSRNSGGRKSTDTEEGSRRKETGEPGSDSVSIPTSMAGGDTRGRRRYPGAAVIRLVVQCLISVLTYF